MVNTGKIKGKLVELGISVEEAAKALNIDRATLYRRLNSGGSSFTIGEATALAKLLMLTAKEVNEIFFAQYVA